MERWLFSAGARLYAYTTGQATWQASAADLVRHFPAGTAPLRVLDLGCGPGFVVRACLTHVPGARAIGIDIAPGMLAVARRAGEVAGAAWVLGDALRLPIADGRIDVVTGHSFLYLVPDRAVVLREAWRVLRPGGRIVLFEPHAGARVWRAVRSARGGRRFTLSVALWHAYARRHGRFTLGSLAETLQAAGFTDISAEEALFGLAVLAHGVRP